MYASDRKVKIAPVAPKKMGVIPYNPSPVYGSNRRLRHEKDLKDFNLQERLGDIKIDEKYIAVLTGAGRDLDLSDPKDLADFLVLNNHPWVAQDEKSKNADGVLFVIRDSAWQAKQKVNRKEKEYEALTIIRNLSDDQLAYTSRLYGCTYDEKHTQSALFKEYLLNKAEEDAIDFVERWKSSDREIIIFIQELVHFSVLNLSNSGYGYKNSLLASTIDSLIEWMRRPLNMEQVGLFKQDLLRAKQREGLIIKDQLELNPISD